ncbi:hypothetical protein OJ996_19860 [Luteolibacter sp. GHJ8]|uniref:Short subunit dehydrogenase n=1 Tax=Luteolibacter rhizosphaerae TaxID=2989719 RepID=A0ABT3G7M3_9BACT|nr:hypothetical protein [Luteolibacter rhizosphaerae]MCW1915853.1 hypothetical protein [Luteolibacter rhizosphaerae]
MNILISSSARSANRVSALGFLGAFLDRFMAENRHIRFRSVAPVLDDALEMMGTDATHDQMAAAVKRMIEVREGRVVIGPATAEDRY